MDEDVKAKFDQLMSRSMAQEAMLQTLLRMFADSAKALERMRTSLDDLHEALSPAEKGELPPSLYSKRSMTGVLRVRSIDHEGAPHVLVKRGGEPAKSLLPAEARELADEVEAGDLDFARRLRVAAHYASKGDYRDVD
jgi:uncharacterized coiled-coil protein SlyX